MDQRRRWALVLLSTGVGSFVTAANLSTINIAFPDVRASFPDDSLAAIGWVINAYTIAFGAMLLPAGRLADSHGRRRVFFAGLALFSVGSVVTAVAPVLSLVVFGRATQGVASALIVPSSLGLLLEAARPADRTRSVALYGGITAVGIATGPTLGALVVETAGWRWSFLVSPPFALVAWLVGRSALERTQRTSGSEVDKAGIVLAAAAMALVSLGIAEGPEWGWTSTRTVAAVGVGSLVGTLFVLRCRGHRAPVLPLDLFRVRAFSLSVSATVLFGAATGAVLLANVLFLTGVWGYSILGAGLAMAPSPIAAALASPMVGRLGTRFGERALAVPGALLFAAAAAWYAWRAGTTPHYWVDWFPAAVLQGLGINVAFPMLQSAGVRDVAPARFSVANAATRAALQLGTAIGVALLVAILGTGVQTLGDFRSAWVVVASCAVGSALLASAISAREVVPAGSGAWAPQAMEKPEADAVGGGG